MPQEPQSTRAEVVPSGEPRKHDVVSRADVTSDTLHHGRGVAGWGNSRYLRSDQRISPPKNPHSRVLSLHPRRLTSSFRGDTRRTGHTHRRSPVGRTLTFGTETQGSVKSQSSWRALGPITTTPVPRNSCHTKVVESKGTRSTLPPYLYLHDPPAPRR